MVNYFEECQKCIPPKRKPGCQDHCGEYAKGRAKLEEDKARAAEANAGWDYTNKLIREKRNATAMRRKFGRQYGKTRYM